MSEFDPPSSSTPPPPPQFPPSHSSPPPFSRPPGFSTQRELEPLPWEQREKLGMVPALVETVRLFLTETRSAFGRIRQDGDYVSPFMFALIIGWAMTVVAQIWNLAFNSVVDQSAYYDLMREMGFPIEVPTGSAIFYQSLITLLLYPFILVLILFISGGLIHLSLLLVGGLTDSETGFEGTFKLVCYTQISAFGQVVPIVGWLITFAAALVLSIIGIQSVHRAGLIQAIIGALMPAFLCCLCAIVIFAAAGMAAAGAIASGLG